MTQSLEIDSLTLQSWLENGDLVEVVDIRPEADFEAWHVPGSINVDAYQAIYAHSPGPLADYRPEDDRPVITVCFVGQTSKIAARYLRSRGIEARSLSGGMQSWSLSWNVAEVELPSSAAEVVQVRRTGKGCLSYLVGSQGEALVIDPSLDSQLYLELAASRGWRITQVVDTHVHADHLSRSRQLAGLTGATYYLPKQERVKFDSQMLEAGGELWVGDARLRGIHAPGHTFESMSLMLDKAALFTGDTLFLNSIGRPDLNAGRTETMIRARALHQTLRRLADLGPEVLILPGHSTRPVAFDGVPIASPLKLVLSKVKAIHYSEDEFVNWVLERIPPNPPNYETIVQLNERGVLPDTDPSLLEAGANRCAM